MEKELRRQMEASAALKADTELNEWKHVLGTVLMQQGKHEESLVLMEASLKHRQRVYGKDDPETCELAGVPACHAST